MVLLKFMMGRVADHNPQFQSIIAFCLMFTIIFMMNIIPDYHHQKNFHWILKLIISENIKYSCHANWGLRSPFPYGCETVTCPPNYYEYSFLEHVLAIPPNVNSPNLKRVNWGGYIKEILQCWTKNLYVVKLYLYIPKIMREFLLG